MWGCHVTNLCTALGGGLEHHGNEGERIKREALPLIAMMTFAWALSPDPIVFQTIF